MKALGYVIYQIWSIKSKMSDEEEWTISPCQPMPDFKKRIYETRSSAEDAVRQMLKHYNTGGNWHDHEYFILPIYTTEEDFKPVTEAYWERRNNEKKTIT